jgi:long-chain acyl-CoA synthetase
MKTLWDLRHHAQRTPQRIAVECGDERMCYGELEALANRLAAVLRGMGLQRGDHIACLIGNRPEALALGWAAWRSGLYLTPMSTALTAHELHYLVQDSDAKAVFVLAALGELAAPLPELSEASNGTALQWFSLRGVIPGFTQLEPLLAKASPEAQADEPPGALMMYTSGTTGQPKGVIRPLLAPDWRGTPPFAADLIEIFGLAGADLRYLSTAPLYHAAPLRFALAVTAGGGMVFLMQGFEAESALRLLELESITHSQWVPTMFQRLLALPAALREAFKAPAHRCAIHGAAPCAPALKRAMIDWWGPILVEYYAGSEGVGLTLIDSHEALQRPGSVGRARKGVLHICDEAGNELPAGQSGLVRFEGVAPFAYHKDPGKTAARTTSQGWQTLGDIGHLDAAGYLYLTDRLDDMIISGGVNLYPQEIEAALLRLASVADCAVVGWPDERFGERPVAFVVAAPDAAGDPASLLAAIQAHCAQHLGRFKRPSEIRIVGALPYSPTGKLLRRELRRIV